jgi:hypothetical protein
MFLQYHSNQIYFQHIFFNNVGNLCFKFESQQENRKNNFFIIIGNVTSYLSIF